jgi:hypothetical protein
VRARRDLSWPRGHPRACSNAGAACAAELSPPKGVSPVGSIVSMRRILAAWCAIAAGCGSAPAERARVSPIQVGHGAPAERAQASARLPVATIEPEAFPVEGGELGTAHPLFVQAAAPDGSWVAACQARSDTDGNGEVAVMTGHHGELFGDDVALYLLTEDRPEGEPLERLVAHDATGKWIAFVRGGRLVARDTGAGTEIDLTSSGAQSAADPNPTLPDRGADFDRAGAHLIYLRGVAGSERVVVLELGSGAEREIGVGAGRVWRAHFVGDGAFVAVAVVPADTNGNGQLDLPVQQTTLAGGACRGAPLSYSTYGFRGDDFEWRFVRLRDGRRESREVRAYGGDGLVVRDRGALRWVSAAGDDRELVPASCDPALLAVWPEGSAVLVGCRAQGTPSPLRVYDARGAHDLGASHDVTHDRDPMVARIVPLDAGFLIDLATPRAFPRAYAGEQALHGSTVLETVEGGVMRFRDLETLRITWLTDGTDRYVHGEQHGRFAAVQHGERVIVIDLETQRITGALPALPVAMRADGAALVPSATDDRIPHGPLRWLRAPSATEE